MEQISPFRGWEIRRNIEARGRVLREVENPAESRRGVLEQFRIPAQPRAEDAQRKAEIRHLAKAVLDSAELMRTRGGANLVRYEDHAVRQAEDGVGWEIALLAEPVMPMPLLLEHRGPMNGETVRRIGTDLASALEQMEAMGIRHGAIDPWNVFVSEDGTFKLGCPAGEPDRTGDFCAPEVAAGAEPDGRSDLYSLGMVLYWCLNGRRLPFGAEGDGTALSRRLAGEAFPYPASGSPDEAGPILRACAFRPQDRFDSAAEFRDALLAAGEEKTLFQEPADPDEDEAALFAEPEDLAIPTVEELIAAEPATPAVSFCIRCGAPLSPGMRFCTKCGARQEEVPAAPAYTPPAQPTYAPGETQVFAPVQELQYAPAPAEPIREEPKKKKGWIAAVIAAAVILGAGGGVLAALQPWNSQPAADGRPGQDPSVTASDPGTQAGKPDSGSADAAEIPGTEAPAETPSEMPAETSAPSSSPTPTEPEVSQYIEVIAAGHNQAATLTLYTWREGQWVTDMTCQAWLGSNGVSTSKTEGDKCTPGGTFDILFYLALTELDSGLEFYQVRSGDVWVEDSDSQYYNTIQNGSGDWDESSDLYAHFSGGSSNACIAFSYNGDCRTPGSATPHAGSDIFIDGVRDSALVPNWGDVRISQANMTRLLSLLEASRHPTITIK